MHRPVSRRRRPFRRLLGKSGERKQYQTGRNSKAIGRNIAISRRAIVLSVCDHVAGCSIIVVALLGCVILLVVDLTLTVVLRCQTHLLLIISSLLERYCCDVVAKCPPHRTASITPRKKYESLCDYIETSEVDEEQGSQSGKLTDIDEKESQSAPILAIDSSTRSTIQNKDIEARLSSPGLICYTKGYVEASPESSPDSPVDQLFGKDEAASKHEARTDQYEISGAQGLLLEVADDDVRVTSAIGATPGAVVENEHAREPLPASEDLETDGTQQLARDLPAPDVSESNKENYTPIIPPKVSGILLKEATHWRGSSQTEASGEVQRPMWPQLAASNNKDATSKTEGSANSTENASSKTGGAPSDNPGAASTPSDTFKQRSNPFATNPHIAEQLKLAKEYQATSTPARRNKSTNMKSKGKPSIARGSHALNTISEISVESHEVDSPPRLPAKTTITSVSQATFLGAALSSHLGARNLQQSQQIEAASGGTEERFGGIAGYAIPTDAPLSSPPGIQRADRGFLGAFDLMVAEGLLMRPLIPAPSSRQTSGQEAREADIDDSARNKNDGSTNISKTTSDPSVLSSEVHKLDPSHKVDDRKARQAIRKRLDAALLERDSLCKRVASGFNLDDFLHLRTIAAGYNAHREVLASKSLQGKLSKEDDKAYPRLSENSLAPAAPKNKPLSQHKEGMKQKSHKK